MTCKYASHPDRSAPRGPRAAGIGRWVHIAILVVGAWLSAGCLPRLPPFPDLPIVPPRPDAGVEEEEPLAAPVTEPAGYVLFLGTDRTATFGPWRTDTLILASVQPDHIVLISIPRDLHVQLPGYGSLRINQLDYLGERQELGMGPVYIANVLDDLMGIRVDHWVRFHMHGMEPLFELIGTLRMELHCPFYERVWDANTARMEWLFIPSGIVDMDANTAYLYARLRGFSSDFGRIARQRALLWALREQLDSVKALQLLPLALSLLRDDLSTDLSLGELVQLVQVGMTRPRDSILALSIDRRFVVDHVAAGGAEVQVLRDPAVLRDVAAQPIPWAEPMGLQDTAECPVPQLSDDEHQRIARLDNVVPSHIPAGRTLQIAGSGGAMVALRERPDQSSGAMAWLPPGTLVTSASESDGLPVSDGGRRWHAVTTVDQRHGWISDLYLRMLPRDERVG